MSELSQSLHSDVCRCFYCLPLMRIRSTTCRRIGAVLSQQNDNQTAFLRSVRAGNINSVIQHLEKHGSSVNVANHNGLTALHVACKEGHEQIIKELFNRGANLELRTRKGNTALHVAALTGRLNILELLISKGADVNSQSKNGFTPMYMAAQENHEAVVSSLLDHGAIQSLATQDGFTPLSVALQQGHTNIVAKLLEKSNNKPHLPALHISAKKDDCVSAQNLLKTEGLQIDATSRSGFTALHIAAHYGSTNVASLLVDNNANINYAAKHQITPLHVATKWGRLEIVRLLCARGACIESATNDGLTPLHCASRSGHDSVVDYLLQQGACISAKTKNGLTPLHMATQGGHTNTAVILFSHNVPVDDISLDYLTALHIAAHCGNIDVAKLLLEHDADPNFRALNGFTPLHIACKKNRYNIVELLLQLDSKIDSATESGLTPLHIACFLGHKEIVELLIRYRASTEVKTLRNETALHLCVRANQIEVMKILFQHGCEVNAANKDGYTPLHTAAQLGNHKVVAILAQYGANVDAVTTDLCTPAYLAVKENRINVIQQLEKLGANLSIPNSRGYTYLHASCKYDRLLILNHLLHTRGCELNTKTKNGSHALHIAIIRKHERLVEPLIIAGCDVNCTNKHGYTPLHIAAKTNQMNVLTCLIRSNASINAKSLSGFTSLHLASQHGHLPVVDLLLSHGADPMIASRNGLTALHLASQYNHIHCATRLCEHTPVCVHSTTNSGFTPLHVASHHGHLAMAEFLLNRNAQVNAATNAGYTPLHQSVQQGHYDLVQLLLDSKSCVDAVTKAGLRPIDIANYLDNSLITNTLSEYVINSGNTRDTSSSSDRKLASDGQDVPPASTCRVQRRPDQISTRVDVHTSEHSAAITARSARDNTAPIARDVSQENAVLLNGLQHLSFSPVMPETVKQNFVTETDTESDVDSLSDVEEKNKCAKQPNSLGSKMDVSKYETLSRNASNERDLIDSIESPHISRDCLAKYSEDAYLDTVERHPVVAGFLISFIADARGVVMIGSKRCGVRFIVPPCRTIEPTRITFRFIKPDRLPSPPVLIDGESYACRTVEMSPVGKSFTSPILIEIPHFTSLLKGIRELFILKSYDGNTWKLHHNVQKQSQMFSHIKKNFSFEELQKLQILKSNHYVNIITEDIPQYFAILSRWKQDVYCVGIHGDTIHSTICPEVEVHIPYGAFTKQIDIALQVQIVDDKIKAHTLFNNVIFSPIVTIEPRRRKFHKPVRFSIPLKQIFEENGYSNIEEISIEDHSRTILMCSISGSNSDAFWEDITESTHITVNDSCVIFNSTVSAKFWALRVPSSNCIEMTAINHLYTELNRAVYLARLIIYAKRTGKSNGQLRIFCVTDDQEKNSLECYENFVEIASSPEFQLRDKTILSINLDGNIINSDTKSTSNILTFFPFEENRLHVNFYVKDPLQQLKSNLTAYTVSNNVIEDHICSMQVSIPDQIVSCQSFCINSQTKSSLIFSQSNDRISSKEDEDFNVSSPCCQLLRSISNDRVYNSENCLPNSDAAFFNNKSFSSMEVAKCLPNNLQSKFGNNLLHSSLKQSKTTKSLITKTVIIDTATKSCVKSGFYNDNFCSVPDVLNISDEIIQKASSLQYIGDNSVTALQNRHVVESLNSIGECENSFKLPRTIHDMDIDIDKKVEKILLDNYLSSASDIVKNILKNSIRLVNEIDLTDHVDSNHVIGKFCVNYDSLSEKQNFKKKKLVNFSSLNFTEDISTEIVAKDFIKFITEKALNHLSNKEGSKENVYNVPVHDFTPTENVKKPYFEDDAAHLFYDNCNKKNMLSDFNEVDNQESTSGHFFSETDDTNNSTSNEHSILDNCISVSSMHENQDIGINLDKQLSNDCMNSICNPLSEYDSNNCECRVLDIQNIEDANNKDHTALNTPNDSSNSFSHITENFFSICDNSYNYLNDAKNLDNNSYVDNRYIYFPDYDSINSPRSFCETIIEEDEEDLVSDSDFSGVDLGTTTGSNINITNEYENNIMMLDFDDGDTGTLRRKSPHFKTIRSMSCGSFPYIEHSIYTIEKHHKSDFDLPNCEVCTNFKSDGTCNEIYDYDACSQRSLSSLEEFERLESQCTLSLQLTDSSEQSENMFHHISEVDHIFASKTNFNKTNSELNYAIVRNECADKFQTTCALISIAREENFPSEHSDDNDKRICGVNQ